MAESVNFNFGSDYDFYNRVESNDVGYSVFDESYIHTTQLFDGILVPVGLWETVPGDSWNLDIDFLVKTVPLKVPVMSSYKIFFNTYYLSNYDMWRDFKNFVTRGRSGNYEVVPPYVVPSPSQRADDGDRAFHLFSNHSLWSYFGLPQFSFYTGNDLNSLAYVETISKGDFSVPSGSPDPSAVIDDLDNLQVSAFPFFMYHRIKRDFFSVKNLAQEVSDLFPDDDDDIQLKSGANYDLNRTFTGSYLGNWTNLMSLSDVCLRGDYFNAAMPWPQRGTPPTLSGTMESTINIPSLDVNSFTGSSQSLVTVYGQGSSSQTGLLQLEKVSESGGQAFYQVMNQDSPFEKTYDLMAGLIPGKIGTTTPTSISMGTVNLSISMSDLRVLASTNLWQERNGRTDGDYNSMITAHFGFNPHIEDHTPTYLGGYYQNIYFNEVVQTSESSADSPLGNKAGSGQVAASGSLGSFRSPDFGWIMTVCYIMPDLSYAQGIDRKWTRHTFADYYYPEFNALGPQAILNKEIFYSVDSNIDNAVFAWQNRFDEFRIQRNISTASIGNRLSLDWNSYTATRWFDSVPPFNLNFNRAKNQLPHNAFSTGVADFPFLLQVANRARVSRPMPYYAMPSSLGLK